MATGVPFTSNSTLFCGKRVDIDVCQISGIYITGKAGTKRQIFVGQQLHSNQPERSLSWSGVSKAVANFQSISVEKKWFTIQPDTRDKAIVNVFPAHLYTLNHHAAGTSGSSSTQMQSQRRSSVVGCTVWWPVGSYLRHHQQCLATPCAYIF